MERFTAKLTFGIPEVRDNSSETWKACRSAINVGKHPRVALVAQPEEYLRAAD